MSEADRTKLVGKEYTGVVTIRTVRLRPDGAAVIEAEAPSEAGEPRVRVRFLTHSTDKALDTLSRDLEVRVRARLSSLAGTATAPVVDFTEMSIVTGG